jgi:plasmid maintenance system antidote protein VapI
MANGKVHIGEIICQKLKEEGRSKKWLAERVHCDQSNLCKILQKSSMDTDLFLKISFAVQHDFLQYLSGYYNEHQNGK